MTLSLDRSTWTRVKFGDVIESVTDRVDDPSKAGVDRYVGLEHLDPGSMTVNRWGTPDQVEAQKLRFLPGDVIFGRRRAYQRKVARAAFEGICSAHALVLRAKPGKIDPDFLPVFLSSDVFLDRAVKISVGSLSPTVNWKTLAVQEFDMPPLDEQKRIAELLWAAEEHSHRLREVVSEAEHVDAIAASERLAVLTAAHPHEPITSLVDESRPLCYGVVQPGREADNGVPLVRVCDMESEAIDIAGLRSITSEIDSQYKRSRLAAGDVLISVVGTIGRVHVATAAMTGLNIARAVARIAPDQSRVDPGYLAYLLRVPTYQALLEREAFESARKTLNLGVLGSIELPVPPLQVQQDFLLSMHLTREAVNAARTELKSLEALSSALRRCTLGGER